MSINKKISFNRTIPIRHDVDIFVAGGGPAGVAAAVCAARCGCSVFLAEGQGCLGGMGTSGLVPAFMQFSDGINFLAAGIGEEILSKLRNAGGTGPNNMFSIRAEVLKKVYDDLLLESGVEFTFMTQLIGVEKEGDRVSLAILSAKSGIYAIKAKIFIDCTGDGDLSVLSGGLFEKGDIEGNMMPGTLCSLWSGINWNKVNKHGDEIALEKAFKDKVFTNEDRHLPGMWCVGEQVGGGNIGHAYGVDGTDEVSLTKAYIDERKRISEYENYYKNYLSGFENMELVSTGALMGIRESRRIMGEYVLNVEDFKKRAVFEDEIGRYCYPIDIHASKPDLASYKKFDEDFRKSFRYNEGESYGIPYGSLVPKGLANVLVAGRCISSDRYIQGSIRVMPGCYITGQAVGIAASIAVIENCNTRDVNISKLQEKLVSVGAYLPNYK